MCIYISIKHKTIFEEKNTIGVICNKTVCIPMSVSRMFMSIVTLGAYYITIQRHALYSICCCMIHAVMPDLHKSYPPPPQLHLPSQPPFSSKYFHSIRVNLVYVDERLMINCWITIHRTFQKWKSQKFLNSSKISPISWNLLLCSTK